MGANGAIVMSFFGALFAALTLLMQLQETGIAIALPFIAFVLIVAAALIVMRLPGTFTKPDGSGRVIMWSSVGEGAALFIVNELLINFGRSDLIIPAMALIVGLHFIPIAYWAPFRPLYVLATIMVIAGLAGLLAAQPVGGTIAGFTAAGALTIASITAVLRERSAKQVYRHSQEGRSSGRERL